MNQSIRILNGRPLPSSPSTWETKWKKKLAESGVEMFSLPLLDFVPEPQSACTLGEVVPEKFNGIFVSSPRGLQFFQEILFTHPKEWKEWLKKPLYTLSQGVVSKAKELGFSIGFCSKQKSLKGFLQELGEPRAWKNGGAHQKWFHPCSQKTRLNPKDFAKRNIYVENIPLYIPICPPSSTDDFPKEWGFFQGCILSSGTTVEHFFLCVQRAKQVLRDSFREDFLEQITFYSLGPSVTEVLKKHHISRIEEGAAGDIEGMYDRIMNRSQGKTK